VNKLRGGCSPRPGSPRWTPNTSTATSSTPTTSPPGPAHVSGTSTVRTRASAQAIAADSDLRCTDRRPTSANPTNRASGPRPGHVAGEPLPDGSLGEAPRVGAASTGLPYVRQRIVKRTAVDALCRSHGSLSGHENRRP